MAGEPKISTVTVIPFDKFWKWLQGHPNCILSAGTGDVLVHDSDDFHWHFAQEENGDFVVEVIRGKQLVAEMVIVPREISCVQVEPKAEEEFLFECIVENEDDRIAAYQFVLSHGYDETQSAAPGRWVH